MGKTTSFSFFVGNTREPHSLVGRAIIAELETMVLLTPGQISNCVGFGEILDIASCGYRGSGAQLARHIDC